MMDMSHDCRLHAVTNLIVYDSERNSIDSSLRIQLIKDLRHAIETNPKNKILVPCLPLLKQDRLEASEYLYWRGYCVSVYCKVKDEHVSDIEWKQGKRWKDPLVTIVSNLCYKQPLTWYNFLYAFICQY